MGPSLSVAFLAAVLAPAVSNVFAHAQLAAGCTTSSFTTPSWLVEDFESQASADLTATSFRALNRATNSSLELRCSSTDSSAGWQSCTARNQSGAEQPLVASFQADSSTASFRFNETWTCSDMNSRDPLTFTAVGNGSVALNCTTGSSTTCRATKPLLVKASLLSPVEITPAYVNGPTGHDTDGCTAQARTPAWHVTATQINLQTSEETVQSGNAFIMIRNDNLGYTASCGGTFSSAGGGQLLTCSGQTAVRRPDKYQIQSTLMFDPQTFDLTVDQTWFCDDQDPAQPISITASGSTTLPLECNVFNPQTTFCTGGSEAPFTGNITSRALLPPYSLNDPLATAPSCTISSIISPAWWFTNFETNTTTQNSEVVTARFGMELQTREQPTGYTAYVVTNGVQYSNESAGEVEELPWYECGIESMGDPALSPTECEFRYDMASRFLGLRVGWACADLDAGSPVAFSGEARTLVPEMTCVTASGGSIRCAAPDPQPWRVNVSSVAWE